VTWEEPSRGCRRVQEALCVLSATADDNADTLDDGRTPPSINEAPYGPALINDAESSALASARLGDRLRASPGRCISIDLEGPRLGSNGHICFIQVAVDGDGKAPPLIHVFDIIECGHHALGSDDGLRAILEDAAIPKVLHSCYGDVAALYRQFNILTRHVFDTALADSLCLCRPANKSRGLKAVVSQWVEITLRLRKG
jgi:ribonuclease D